MDPNSNGFEYNTKRQYPIYAKEDKCAICTQYVFICFHTNTFPEGKYMCVLNIRLHVCALTKFYLHFQGSLT